MTIRSFQDLEVWQLAMDLVTLIYDSSKAFPPDERFGLTSQVRRAAISVPSNIAEGQGRRTTGEFLQFLSTVRGSLMELRTQVEIARRLSYLSDEGAAKLEQDACSVGRLLNGLINALERKQESNH